MTLANFAQYQRAMGVKVHEAEGHYWHQVRPFFFRPVWPLQEFEPQEERSPWMAKLGGVQYSIPPGHRGNSVLNFFVFDDPVSYDVSTLSRKPRKQVRLAQEAFVVRRLIDADTFKREAFPVYASFFKRTGYPVLSERRDQAFFERWTDQLFDIPGLLLLGGYRGQQLGGVSISLRIDDTIYYAAVFCDTPSMETHLSDLMLHTIRSSAAAAPFVKRVLVGMFKGDSRLDDFKRLRGARLWRKPSYVRLNPLADAMLRVSSPRQHARILGLLDGEDIGSVLDSTTRDPTPA